MVPDVKRNNQVLARPGFGDLAITAARSSVINSRASDYASKLTYTQPRVFLGTKALTSDTGGFDNATLEKVLNNSKSGFLVLSMEV